MNKIFKQKRCLIFQSWDVFFRNAENGAVPGEAYQSPPEIYGHPVRYTTEVTVQEPLRQATELAPSAVSSLIQEHLAVYSLIRSYQVMRD